MNNRFNPDYLGEQTPWFGPIIEGYNTVLNTEMHFLPPGGHELTMWAWDNAGRIMGEKVIGTFTAEDTVTLDIGAIFQEMRGRGGVIGLTFHGGTRSAAYYGMSFYSRFYRADGHLAAVVNSSNAKDLNHVARSRRKYTYRMCSQQMFSDAEWRPLSWHANVSADPLYTTEIDCTVTLYNERGERLTAPNLKIAPFGALLVDIEALFEGDLLRHLASGGGRGSLTVTAENGGAIGYHFLQRRASLELAGDHTRPVWKYLNMGYGARSSTVSAGPIDYLKSLKPFAKFHLQSRS